MTQLPSGDNAGKGKAFFDRGDQVAATNNWDFAIQMYLEGLRRQPENLDRGHKPMRDVSLKRKASGGKPLGMFEQMKVKGGKDPLEAMLKAELLLAKDPGNISYMVEVLKQALALDLRPVAKWIGDIVLETQRLAKSPNKQIMKMLATAYTQLEEFSSAVTVCDMGARLFPNEAEFQDLAKNLSARQTIKQGQYDGSANFLKSVKNIDAQLKLNASDQIVQSRDMQEKFIADARAAYEAAPTVPGKIDGLADVLLKVEEEGYENEAIDVLKKAHADTGQYRFKVRIDDVKIKQLRRRFNVFKANGETDKALAMGKELLNFELAVYAERTANYPTDLGLKFELGRRQMAAGKIDDAIASLQQAQRDPKRHLLAMSMLGQAFNKKGWHREAADTFTRALEGEPSEERAKELHYNLADALEQMGESAKALEHFSRVAQIDFNFRDVRTRIENLRKKIS